MASKQFNIICIRAVILLVAYFMKSGVDCAVTVSKGSVPLHSQNNNIIQSEAAAAPALTTSPSNSIRSMETIPVSAPPPEDRKIVCYLGTWSYYRVGDGKFEIRDIDPFLCTHVVYAFAKLNEDTNQMEAFDSYLDIDLGGYKKFVALKEQNPDLKVLLAVGGWSDGSEKYSNMASSQTTRNTFVQSALGLIQQYSFDGLDLDWEYPANRGGRPEDKANFALLVSDLRTAFDASGLLLTAAIGIGADILETAYDFGSLCQDLDFINLMAYDLHGSWESFTGHHTSLHAHPKIGDTDYGLTEALNLVKELGGCLNKMILGMGTYGKSYTLQYEQLTDIGDPVVGPGMAGPYTGENGTLGFNEICLNSNYERDIDDYTMAPWVFDGFQWVCYDDVEAIKYKSEWALQNGLLGGMIWSLETDDFRGACGQGRYPLLSQINKSIRPAPAATTSPTMSNGPSSSTATFPPITNERKIVCYLGTWSYYRVGDGKFEIRDIDASLCTHAVYAFATLNGDTNQMEPFDSYLDIDLGGYEKFVALKEQNPDLKVLLAVGGWSDESEKYSNMASSQTTRNTFVQSALGLIQQYSFDGLDLDWEYPANRGGRPEDKANFALLVSDLRTAFNGHGLLLTSAIGIGQEVLETAYDFGSLCQDLDLLNLMAYDLHGPWESFTGHHTSLHAHPALGETDYGLTEALKVLRSLDACVDKMVLGMGTYGKSYTLQNEQSTGIGAPVDGAGNAGVFTKESGMLGYNEICLGTGYERDIDTYTMAPWAYKGDQWVCYDDVESIRVKCEWALQNGMIGGMIWSLETDDFRGNCGAGRFPLLTQINESMRSASNITQTTTSSAVSTTSTTTSTSTDVVSSSSTVDSVETSSSTSSTGSSGETTSTETTSTTSTTTVDPGTSPSTSTSSSQGSSDPSTTTPSLTTTEATGTTEKNNAKFLTPISFFGLLMASLIPVLILQEMLVLKFV